MNKSECLKRIAALLDCSIAEAKAHYNAFVAVLGEALHERERVTLKDMGTFEVKHRPSRPGRNPATGESITVPAKDVIRFKPAKALSDHLN